MKKDQIPSSLVHVHDGMPGYHRIKKRAKFVYQDDQGDLLTDKEIISRIEELVIPPMWEDVWICKKPHGHIQATGRDTKGRKQYIYHTRWNKYINRKKFNGLLSFARCLPKIREKTEQDLRKKKWKKEKVVALAVRLMDELYLRVGNKYYEEENGTYGLTTLRKKHLKKEKNNLVLKYTAKSGKLRKVNIQDKKLKRLIRQCSELPGYELFRYQSGRKFIPIDSMDINAYLRDATGMDITAKMFRTWGGTVLTVKLEPQARAICTEFPRRKIETTLVRLVAKQLNNTVSVCRDYYIHPEVLKKAIAGKIEDFIPPEENDPPGLYPEERVVLNILEKGIAKNDPDQPQ